MSHLGLTSSVHVIGIRDLLRWVGKKVDDGALINFRSDLTEEVLLLEIVAYIPDKGGCKMVDLYGDNTYNQLQRSMSLSKFSYSN